MLRRASGTAEPLGSRDLHIVQALEGTATASSGTFVDNRVDYN